MTDQHVPPTRISSLAAAAVGIALVVALFRHSSVPRLPFVMSLVGVLSLVLCLSLAERSPDRGALLLVSILAVPVAVGFLGGILGSTLVLVGNQFPVPTDAEISIAILRVAGNLGVLVGCALAVFGLVLGYRNVLSADSLSRYTKVVFVTAVVPLLTGSLLFVRVAVAGNRRAAESPFGQLVRQTATVLFSPEPTRLHLGSFLFVLTVVGGALVLFLRKAPIAELLDGDHLANVRRTERLQRALYVLVTATAALMAVSVLLEVAFSPGELQRRLGTGLFDTIQLVTTAGWLRLLLWAVGLAATAWLALEFTLRQLSDRPGAEGKWLGPLAGGVALTVLASATAGPVFNRTLQETTSRLPAVFASNVQNTAVPMVNVYGETALVVLATGALLAVTAWIGLVLRLAVSFGYLSNEGAGFSIASAGLLYAAVSVGALAPPRWLVLGGIAAALIVWDLGRFGTRLGREVGRSDTGGVELVHAGATLAVGALAVVAAAFLESRAGEAAFDPDPTVALAIVSLVVALVAGSLALRGTVSWR